jgi:CheY-like chemotaxis protein
VNTNPYPVVATSPRAVLVNTAPGGIEMSEDSWEWGQYDWFLIDGTDTAYATIRTLRPDLIVLLMPINGENGCRLISVLRLDDDTAAIPILIYTSLADDPDIGPPCQEESLHSN